MLHMVSQCNPEVLKFFSASYSRMHRLHRVPVSTYKVDSMRCQQSPPPHLVEEGLLNFIRDSLQLFFVKVLGHDPDVLLAGCQHKHPALTAGRGSCASVPVSREERHPSRRSLQAPFSGYLALLEVLVLYRSLASYQVKDLGNGEEKL